MVEKSIKFFLYAHLSAKKQSFSRKNHFLAETNFSGFTFLLLQYFNVSLCLIAICFNLQIGFWNDVRNEANTEHQPTLNLNISESWMEHYTETKEANETLIVTTVINSPYTMLRDSADSRIGKISSGSEWYANTF